MKNQKQLITYNQIEKGLEKLKLKSKPDLILYPRRGGMWVAMMIAYKYNITNLVGLDIQTYGDDNKQLKSFKAFNGMSDLDKHKISNANQILIVDDIIDTGNTIDIILDLFPLNFNFTYEILSIMDKKGIADYKLVETQEGWIDFPWDKISKDENN